MEEDIFANRSSRILIRLVEANAGKIEDSLVRRASRLRRDNEAYSNLAYLSLASSLETIGYTLSRGYGREMRWRKY